MRPKQFAIGISAFVLAIAGAFATKASNNLKITNGFTFNGTAASSSSSWSFDPANQPCRTSYPNGRILYTAATKAFNLMIWTIRTAH